MQQMSDASEFTGQPPAVQGPGGATEAADSTGGTPDPQPSRPHNYEEVRILRALRRLMRLVALRSRRLDAEHGITGPQLFCLLTMNVDEPLTAKAIAQHLQVSPSTIVGILDRLVQKELAVRERGVRDRRVVFSKLTEKGRDLVARAPSLLDDRLVQSIADLPESERETIARSLNRVADIIEGKPSDGAAPHGAAERPATGDRS